MSKGSQLEEENKRRKSSTGLRHHYRGRSCLVHSLLLSVAMVILFPEQDDGKRTDGLTEILEEVFMCLYSHWQLKANIYVSYCFLYPLFNFSYKGNLSYRSYSHYKKFYESPVLCFCCFLAKIFWPGSPGSASAISHEGTLKPLKQSSEDFPGSEELAMLALCHPPCSPWHTRTSLSKWRHNFLLLKQVGK